MSAQDKKEKNRSRKKATPKKARAKSPQKKTGPVRRPVTASKGLEQVLAHAQGETRQQLSEAIEKRNKTGRGLMEILKQDVDGEMFRKIWSFLNRPVGKAEDSGSRQVKDVLLEGGWLSEAEWEEAEKTGEAYDPEFGRILVDAGVVTQKQLDEVLDQQNRSGQSFWRILVNRGYATPKQIADARKFGAKSLYPSLGETALGQAVLRTGLVSEDQLREAMVEEKDLKKRSLLQVLVDKGAADKQQLGVAVAREMGIEYVDLKSEPVDRDSMQLLAEHLAEQHLMVPISATDDRVRLAMVNPQDMAARELFRMMVNREVEPVLAFEEDIAKTIRRFHRLPAAKPSEQAPSALERLKARIHGAAATDESMVTMAENAGIINLVASIVEGAINSRATDIHLEPQANELRVRYRIDGMLYDIMNLPDRLKAGVVSRIKVLAGMDITEKRRPQDGHFVIDVTNRNYDLRVASLPTVLGEKIVLRLLNPEDVFRGMRELGLESDQLEIMEEAISMPYGLLLVTGPIGSGKTTTLYAALSQIDILSQNVVTIEDPVEYELPGISQVQVDLRIDRTFANMLRSVVRQDADVMMVGEVRDPDTAEVAVRAALTGHLVFSTLHTNDAAGAVDTLVHMGIPPFLIASSLTLVVAQRLVRRICPECTEEYKPENAALRDVGITPQKARYITFRRGAGCDRCFQTGYQGRTGIYELLRPDADIRKMTIERASHSDINEMARKKGMATLMDAGIEKVKKGITTVEELLRVTVG